MGNQQSAEAPRRTPTKLTKPRTNTSSSNLLAKGPWRNSTIDIRNDSVKRLWPAYTAENGDDTEIEHNGKAGNKTRQRSLLRSRSARPLSKATEMFDSVENYISSTGLDCVRVPESIQHDKAGIAYRNGTDTCVPYRASQSLHPTSQANASAEEALQHREVSGPNSSDQSIAPAFRRCSIQVPGMAARVPSMEKLGRNSLPAKNIYSREASNRSWDSFSRRYDTLKGELQSSSDDLAKPILLPLQRIAPVCCGEPTRAETPTDLGYRHTGAFKLGSLRITNGTASPTPSGPDLKHSEPESVEILEAEVSATVSKQNSTYRSPPFSSRKSGEYIQVEAGGNSNESVRKDPYRFNLDNPAANVHIAQVWDKHSSVGPATANIKKEHLVALDFKQKQPHIPNIDTEATRAYGAAQDFTQDIAVSPFSFEESPSTSPTLGKTPNPKFSEDTVVNVHTNPGFSCVSSGRELGQVEATARDNIFNNSLAKADSGYCSLRSRSSVTETLTASRVPSGRSTKFFLRSSSMNSGIKGAALTNVQRKPPFGSGDLKINKTSTKTYVHEEYVETNVTAPAHSDENGTFPKKPTSRRSMPALQSAERTHNLSDTDTSTPSVKRKIRKVREPPLTGIVVQCCTKTAFADIPAISQEEEASLEKRIKSLPPLTHTYKSVHKTNSKDTLSTSFSMTPAEQAIPGRIPLSKLDRPLPNIPSNSDFERSGKLHTNTSLILDANLRDNEQSRAPGWRSKFHKRFDRSSGRKRSIEDPQESVRLQVTSFGTVSKSLHPGPYDATHRAAVQQASKLAGPISIGHASKPRFVQERSRTSENGQKVKRSRSYEEQRQRDSGQRTPPVPALPADDMRSHGAAGKSKSQQLKSLPMLQKRLSAPLPPIPLKETRLKPVQRETVERSKGQENNQRRVRSETANESIKHIAQLSKTLPSPRSYDSLRQTRNAQPFKQQNQPLQRSLSDLSSFEQGTPNSYPQWSVIEPYSAHPPIHSQDEDVYQPQQQRTQISFSQPRAQPNFPANRPHKHKSEAEPLVLDRYSGGVAFGHGSIYGLGGSAGLRNGTITETGQSGADSGFLSGLDLRDVPVMDLMPRRSVAIG